MTKRKIRNPEDVNKLYASWGLCRQAIQTTLPAYGREDLRNILAMSRNSVNLENSSDLLLGKTLLVVPRTNKIADKLEVRTTAHLFAKEFSQAHAQLVQTIALMDLYDAYLMPDFQYDARWEALDDMNRAPILLVDEFTTDGSSNPLQPYYRQQILAWLRSRARSGKTTILSSWGDIPSTAGWWSEGFVGEIQSYGKVIEAYECQMG